MKLIDGEKLIADLRRYGHETISVDGLEGLIDVMENVHESCKDADSISRQAAIDALRDEFKRTPTNAIRAKTRIEGLPSVQPDLPIKEKCAYCPHCENCDVNDDLSIAQPKLQNARIFQEIVVEYPSYNTYPEYEGKPYFSIKYTENGQDFIGYGTYKPEVLSQYLKEYFMPSAQSEIIRCKECAYGKQDDEGRWYCIDFGCQVGNEDGSGFCSDAERRTNG